MVKNETKEIAKYISVLIFLSALMLLMFWAVVFARYGDHVKYDADTVLSIMLGFGIGCFFIGLTLTGYMMLKAFTQLKEKELKAKDIALEELRVKYRELSGKKI